MRFGIVIPNCGGDYADPRFVAEVAHEAEEAGWDGFFVWDHISDKWAPEVSDPWIMLSAIAMRTHRLKLGTMVTPIPRRRPWKLSRELVTLDHLSGGRIILGVGIGGGAEYTDYGEQADNKLHAEMLDESLELLEELWTGEPVNHQGQHYTVQHVRYLPRPVQQPRIPIWVASVWPNKNPQRRAARWDGIVPIGKGLGPLEQMSPADEQACEEFVRAQQSPERAAQPYDHIHWGVLEGKDAEADRALVEEYSQVGVNWWLENITWSRGTLEEQRERIRKGPPGVR
ncbi:LLM class flavin-dependent oxidoreductase [Tengunoibacter tsumagoiensis]|uniref:Luciferase-like protein n=1 Tax=Tengunoibacter tsumagoiensis TaxID=2014871 RepID=A0A402A4U4_9CHLR|nr:LLM class flavin-dependent oxidoreductase [Tengunoibacter tsumagoiensis]GCE14122.1 luciferase-like protein [Tengunoibacter tsumagoiensis]